MRTNALLLAFILLAAGILFGATNVAAQQTQLSAQQIERLSPQQQETIAQLVNRFVSWNRSLERYAHLEHIKRGIEERNNDIRSIESITDPMLVGQYFVLHPEWLEFVGNGRSGTVTRQQFQAWYDRIQKLYECYENFLGHRATDGISLIRVRATERGEAGTAFHNIITINRGNDSIQNFTESQGMRSSNSLSSTMMHEIAHVFQYSPYSPRATSGRWIADIEGTVDFLVFITP